MKKTPVTPGRQALAALLAAALLLPAPRPTAAQDLPANLPKPLPTNLPADAQAALAAPEAKAKPAPVPPSNPLIMDDPARHSRNDAAFYDAQGNAAPAGGDSPDPAGVNGSKVALTAPQTLTNFGYDFFAPARQIIDAHREFLRRQYQPHPADGAATPGTTKRPARLPRTVAGDAVTGTDETSAPETSTPEAGDQKTTADGSSSVDAFHEVSDPLSQMYRNVTASIPPNYQLAPGDRLTIRYWSPTMAARELTATVDAGGGVTVPGVGRVIVRGQTAAQGETALRLRLRRIYRGADDTVALKELRTISVTIVGAAYAPGTYVVPSVATAFNVLYAAGGPTEDGSMRDVEVRRQGRLVGRIDIYAFLAGGHALTDTPLQPGDIINVPPRLSRVTVRGEVRQPAIFELTPSEGLRQALQYAGGVKPSGVAQHVQINTVDPGAARVLRDVNLNDKAALAQASLYDGDAVDVFSVRTVVANRVTVDGAVDQPGDYALAPGMRVSDLIERARGLLYDAYSPRADLVRVNDDNTTTLVPVNLDQALAHQDGADVRLTRWDRLKVYARSEVTWVGRRQITVRGAVQRPGDYALSQGMRVQDVLLAAGGPLPDAALGRAVLEHQRPDGSFAFQFLDLSSDSAQNSTLQDNDILALYRVGQAQFTPSHTVTIAGEVVAPGVYPRGDGMHLSDLLKLSGGFRPGAASRATIAHAFQAAESESPRLASVVFDAHGQCAADSDTLLKDGDVVTVQGTGDFQDHVTIITLKGAVARPGPVVLTPHMRLSDAIQQAGGLLPDAFPEGAEFVRSPDRMTTGEQNSLSGLISRMNDMINRDAYSRALAQSDIDKYKAMQGASAPSAPAAPLTALAGAATGTASDTSADQATAAAVSPQLAQHNLVSPPRVLADSDLQPVGNIAINMASALKRPGGADDIALVEGDTITVPQTPTTVQVIGAVYNARGVMFKSGAPLAYYVALAGGYTADAAPDRIEVIHAGGGLVDAHAAGALRPGDVILVPTRVLAEKLEHRSSNGLGNFFQGLVGSAVVVKLLGGLL